MRSVLNQTIKHTHIHTHTHTHTEREREREREREGERESATSLLLKTPQQVWMIGQSRDVKCLFFSNKKDYFKIGATAEPL